MLHCPRRLSQIILICAGTLLAATPRVMAADPTGDWRVADGEGKIRIAQCNGSMWGVVAWEREAGGRDVHNPDVSKKNRPLLGMPILLDMKKRPGVDQWQGQVYNAKDGQTYSSTIKPLGSDQLEIQGCLLGFLCGGETWSRVAPPIPSSPSNSMAKGSAKGQAAPRTTGSVNPAAKTSPQKQATAASDPVGDICLLPDVARFAH